MFGFFNSKNKKEKSLPKKLTEIIKRQEELERKIKEVSRKVDSLKKESAFFIQKAAISRYNPFSGVGGNQSFSAVFLDKNNNGIIITSLYTHEGNRVYAKSIKAGKSEYQLSEEEKNLVFGVVKKHEK
ncbi:MAG TPA: DUF4446 family protein [Candidatus Parcubacteria bacterium]|nr:DUF4446 family protein [Candidatus Parcubacteria bacterium]